MEVIENQAITKLDKKVDKIHNVIYGHNGEEGVVTRLARMDERMKTNSKILWGAVFIGGAAAVEGIIGVFLLVTGIAVGGA